LLLTIPEDRPYWDGAMGVRLRYLEEQKARGEPFSALDQEDYNQLSAIADKRDNAAAPFTTSHWDEPNVLVHMRMNDRYFPDENGPSSRVFPKDFAIEEGSVPGPPTRGLRALHLEEVQSDWHQQGRKKGYKSA